MNKKIKIESIGYYEKVFAIGINGFDIIPALRTIETRKEFDKKTQKIFNFCLKNKDKKLKKTIILELI